jgi:hypothetical protein
MPPLAHGLLEDLPQTVHVIAGVIHRIVEIDPGIGPRITADDDVIGPDIPVMQSLTVQMGDRGNAFDQQRQSVV